MLHWTEVVDVESSQAFQTKLVGINGATLVVAAGSVELGALVEPQLATTKNVATNTNRLKM